jgi:hypothetical protein
MAGKARSAYLVKEKTYWEEGTYTGYSQRIFESGYDAFDFVMKIVNDKECQKGVIWKFVQNREESPFGGQVAAIEGYGEFRSLRDEDMGHLLYGRQVIIIEEVNYKEAKRCES